MSDKEHPNNDVVGVDQPEISTNNFNLSYVKLALIYQQSNSDTLLISMISLT